MLSYRAALTARPRTFAANRESLEVEYSDLSGWDPGNTPEGSPYSRIAMWIADAPTEMLAILSEVGSTAVLFRIFLDC